ncbi:Uncharacterized protein PECH_008996 [Penicillium ucsense]|uniref:Nitrogen regulatory protein areA GATA-like domain-containing protein n=1 Tax=Penicillium ucsense TaxID=2839758 RepID=A0A8J8VXM2_9EURO|nr:Uncharacterized protein PECM_001060 [Penicillium ucsense]KAF7733780.1 Uncharacterized protein PECH_008996 [Penicillium ucsense]
MTTVLVNPRDQPSHQFARDSVQSPTVQRYFLGDHGVPPKSSPMQLAYSPRECPSPVPSSTLSSLPASPNFIPSAQDPLAYTPTTLSSLSLADDHEDLILPAYDTELHKLPKSLESDRDRDQDTVSDASQTPTWSCQTPAADDTSVEEEPSRHVDYLSHEWREEDILASWRYVTARKESYSNGVRLENASWRTWAKAKHNLGTVSPEALNWLKDCDVTWLYGPLKTSSFRDVMTLNASPPPSRLETPSSYLEPKPILKKKTMSETILQRSLSQHVLLQHAGAILKAQEAGNNWTRPSFPRSNTDLDHLAHRTGSSTYSLGGTVTTSSWSGMTSPCERRHIHFNNEVEQCIAVEIKDVDDDERWPPAFEEESSSDDSVVMMRQIPSGVPLSSCSTPRTSFSSDSKTIAPLPSTTLKYRGDTPEPRESLFSRWSTSTSSSPSSSSVSPSPSSSSPFAAAAAAASPSSSPSAQLSPTPSVATLRPPQPSANFLLDDDDEDPSLDFTGQYLQRDQPWFASEDEEDRPDRPLHLTSSGMFMPYGDNEGESANPGILGRVVDTVNTARDIAHVIWNVGWRR